LRPPIKIFSARRRLSAALATGESMGRWAKVGLAAAIFLLSFFTKSLQAVDLAPVMYTPEQPFAGLTALYDLRAASIAEGGGLLGPYGIKPTRTEWLAQAPGYSIFLSGVYTLAGRDFFKVQLAQNLVNSVSPVLIFLIAGLLISPRVGAAAGVIAALSHHLSHISNYILPDPLGPLPVLAAVYLLALARKDERRAYLLYAAAGVMIGLSAWLRSQTMLLGIFFLPWLVAASADRRREAKRALVMAAASVLAIAPVTIKNYAVYGEFVPVNIGVGQVLWVGIGETSRGEEFGAVATDDAVAAQDAVIYNNPRYGGSWSTPDGIKRDRDKVKKSLDVIVNHPLWYAGVMLARARDMTKYSAHAPLVFRASEVRPRPAEPQVKPGWESLSADERAMVPGKAVSWMRPLIRAAQRATKETMLPFILIGAALVTLASRRRALLLSVVPLYYLLVHSFLHTEFRYTLAMHYFLFTFAAVVWALIGAGVWRGVRRVAGKNVRARKAEAFTPGAEQS
jgi:hypothetical protein